MFEPPHSIISSIFASIPRICLIFDHTVISLLIHWIPFIGPYLGFLYACLVNAFYCFHFSFSSRGWTLTQISTKLSRDLPYYIAFGIMPTLICSFGPPLLRMAIFALIYPFFVIQALQSRRSGMASDEDSLEAGGSGAATPLFSPKKIFGDDDDLTPPTLSSPTSSRSRSPLPGRNNVSNTYTSSALSEVNLPSSLLQIFPPNIARVIPRYLAEVRDNWLFYLAIHVLLKYTSFIQDRWERYLNRRDGAVARERAIQRKTSYRFEGYGAGMGNSDVGTGTGTDIRASNITHRHG